MLLYNPKELNNLSSKIYQANKEKGFYDSEKNIGEMLALIHSEVSEALESHRKDKFLNNGDGDPNQFLNEILEFGDTQFKTWFNAHVKDTFEDEVADAIIRLLDLCGYLEINIEKHIEAKLRYNSLRPHKHGKNY